MQARFKPQIAVSQNSEQLIFFIHHRKTRNAALLHDLAQKTGGQEYIVGGNGSTLTGLTAVLSSLPKNRTSQKLGYQYYDHFPLFLFLSFLCLGAELLLTGRKKA